jgi:predicted patatin/cPLA2 family phospholipase
MSLPKEVDKNKSFKGKKALCISGGGSMGAWAGGVIQHLTDDLEKDYDLYVGTSTGSLLAPLTSIREITILKEGYTSINSDDIFSINPFTKNGQLHFRAILRAVMMKKTLGESHQLRKTIKNYFKEKHFDRLAKSEKEVIAVVANLTDEIPEYKSSNDYEYEDFVDWLWASANVPEYMSILEKEGNEYADGAIYSHIPVQAAIDRGATEIDVIVLNPEGFGVIKREKIRHIFHYNFKVKRMMHRKIARDSIDLDKLNSYGRDININIYYTPYRLTENPLLFDKDTMIKWWNEGYLFAVQGNAKNCKLTRSNVFKEIE